MIHTEDVFVWIPRNYTPNTKVEITHGSTTTDVTIRVRDGQFIQKATEGIGSFTLKLVNSYNTYTDAFSEGDIVDFYADYTDAATKKFSGRIDFIKDSISEAGKFIEIEGRHISFPLVEIYVNKDYIDKTIDYIIKDIADNFLSGLGFTYANVETFTNVFTVNFSNLLVMDCIRNLCALDNADFYADDNKDLHLFPKNSKFNNNDAIVEGNTLLTASNFGDGDSSSTKNKIIVYGENENGLPIIYTAGTGTREFAVKKSSINTDTEAKDFADSLLAQMNVLDIHGRCICAGLPYVSPGDNIWVSIPRIGAHGLYKIIRIEHILQGPKFWKTNCEVEKPQILLGEILSERINAEKRLMKSDNPNNMKYSYAFNFNDSTNIETFTNTEISDGKLRLSSGFSSGSMETSNKTMPVNITQAELRGSGTDMGSTIISLSADGGVTYDALTRNTLTALTHTGKYAKIKVELNSDAVNVNPELDSMSILMGD